MEVFDRFKYSEEVYEVSLRGSSVEVNHVNNAVYGVRFISDRGLVVVSSNRPDKEFLDSLMYRAGKLSMATGSFNWCVGNVFHGRVSIGSDKGIDPLIDLVKYVYGEIVGKGLKGEVIGVYRRMSRYHMLYDGGEALEERILYELYIYPYTMYMGRLVSTSKLIGWCDPGTLYDRVDEVLESIYREIVSKARARRLNPVYSGKWYVVLTGDASPVLYHEITHLLQADEPVKLPLGYSFEARINMIEEPFHRGPLQRLFDDEVYPAWKRVLVENGSVIDYLHTRSTAGEGSKPGNARGLFTRPKPLHYQLIVRPGDWGFEEMLFESKRSLVIESIIEAKLGGNYIWIYPENTYVAEKDQLTPVKTDLVAIPLDRLQHIIIGLGREQHDRYSFERGYPIYEKAPYTLVEARVFI